MNTVILLTGALIAATFVAAFKRRKQFIVPEGHYGLLYRNGEYRHRISPGRHYFWTNDYSVGLVDMRKLTLTVFGCEASSADHVAVRINTVLTYQIIQAETAIHSVPNYIAHLNETVQTALASIIAASSVELLLNQRLDFDKQLCALLLVEADKIGIVIHAVEVKDVIVAGGLAQVAEALKAQL